MLLAVACAACAPEVTDDDDGSSQSSGGASAVGGSNAAGGTGGVVATGGVSSGGSGGSTASGGAATGGVVGAGGAITSGTFTLTSPQLTEGAAFGDKYTCALAGFNGSLAPALSWTAGPEGTKSYAITLIDVTLTQGEPPSDLGYHWVIYDIPASVLSLPEELKDAATVSAKQNSAYLGPCPNFCLGSCQEPPATHTYEFTVYALDTETLSLTQTTGTAAVKEAEQKLEASHLDSAKLSGTSDAAPP